MAWISHHKYFIFLNMSSLASSTSSTALSTTESSTANYINHISANTTTTTSSGGADTTCSVSPADSNSHAPTSAAKKNALLPQDQQNAKLIEQLVQQQHKATLARQQMFQDHSFRFNAAMTSGGHQQQQQPYDCNQYNNPLGNGANTLNATTAYLVQTPNGNALLIPPQTALNPTNQFIQTNPTNQG